jgi:hypothetical protein
MGCPHEFAEKVKELEPVWVSDLYSNVDIYFCEDCQSQITCQHGTFRIVSHLSMRDEPSDEASDAGNEVYDGLL